MSDQTAMPDTPIGATDGLVIGLDNAALYPPGAARPTADSKPRCWWGAATTDYATYHDNEWGRATDDERTLFEKLCLEGFQAGLSWLTILRKRPAFRAAFADFDAEQVAAYGPADIERLCADAGIVRHRGKIEATIGNARALVALWEQDQRLADLIWSYEPPQGAAPSAMSAIPATTATSTALSKRLRKHGFRFVGPTTTYAAMQAMGLVNDHLSGCWVRQECEASRVSLGRQHVTEA